MQARTWIELLQRIPPAQHNNVMLVTSIGTEINIQDIARIEEEYLVLRGRLGGSTDTGRVFFVPYDQINYFGFQKEVKDAQLRALYGEPEPPPTSASVPSLEASGPTVHVEPAEEASRVPAPPHAVPSAAPQEATAPTSPLSLPDKAALLKRLRARSLAGTAKAPPQP